jgi:adenylate kinase
MIDMLNIVLFGPPGAGKGTQSERLIGQYGLKHISTGDVFRYNIKNGTELGKLAQEFMDDGNLVPDEVTINMLKAEVEKNPDAKGFIFDGFPRTAAQAEALDNLLASLGTNVSMMVALDVPEEELRTRLLERGKTSGRADDQDVEKVNNRIRVYRAETAPVADFYNNQGKFRQVHGVGTIEDIFGRICETVDTVEEA